MAQPELLTYIKENTGKFEKPAIVQALVATGWSLADINAAFLELEHPAATAPAEAPAASAAPVITPPASTPVTPANPVKVLSQAPVQTSQNAAFLAEMQRHRKEAAALNPNKIVDGDVEVSVGGTSGASAQNGIAGMLIKTGLVKTQQQANIFMIVSGIIVFAIGVWWLMR